MSLNFEPSRTRCRAMTTIQLTDQFGQNLNVQLADANRERRARTDIPQ
jgi:hypothetical protein